MKNGAIICICGNVPDGWTVEDQQRFKEATAHYATVKIITPGTSPFLMSYLWLKLILDGITDIVIAKAEFNQKRRLRFKPNSIRLSIVGMN